MKFNPPPSQGLPIALRATVLLTIAGIAAWTTGLSLLFPSLGPTAYVLAANFVERDLMRRVLGAHLIAVVAGFATYHLLAPGLHMLSMDHSALSGVTLRLAASGISAVFLTIWFTVRLRASHGPACATALMVSLGLMSEALDVLLIVTSVALLLAAHWLLARVVRHDGE